MIKMIENERCCEKCRFYEPERRECRRYPPQIWSVEDGFIENFPRVDISQWCGEFQPEESWIVPSGVDFDKPGAGVIHEITS